MADRIGVMRSGRMVQVGTPRDIYDAPANRFVAEFMGVANLWPGIVRDDGLSMELPSIGIVQLAAPAPRGPAVLGVRAERVRIGGDPHVNRFAGTTERTVYAGDTVTHSIRLENGTTALVTEPAHDATTPGATVALSFPPGACMVFPA